LIIRDIKTIIGDINVEDADSKYDRNTGKTES
jgi:hypothetical protein